MKLKFFLTISCTLLLLFLGLYLSELKQKKEFRKELDLLALSFDTLNREKQDINTKLFAANEEINSIQVDLLAAKRQESYLEQEKESAQGQLKSSQVLIEELRSQISKKERAMLSMKNKLYQPSSSMRTRARSDGLGEADSKKINSLVYYNVGVMLSGSSLYTKAIDAFEKSIAIDQSNPDAHYNLAMLYMHLAKSPEKALFHFKKYLNYNANAADEQDVLYTIGKLEAKMWIADKISESTSNL